MRPLACGRCGACESSRSGLTRPCGTFLPGGPSTRHGYPLELRRGLIAGAAASHLDEAISRCAGSGLSGPNGSPKDGSQLGIAFLANGRLHGSVRGPLLLQAVQNTADSGCHRLALSRGDCVHVHGSGLLRLRGCRCLGERGQDQLGSDGSDPERMGYRAGCFHFCLCPCGPLLA